MSNENRLRQKFLDFHRKNPHVYETLRDLAIDYRRRTGRYAGIQMLYEVARWQLSMNTNDEDFKLNNSYAPFYARMLMDRNPQLRGMFRLRKSVADGIEREVAA